MPTAQDLAGRVFGSWDFEASFEDSFGGHGVLKGVEFGFRVLGFGGLGFRDLEGLELWAWHFLDEGFGCSGPLGLWVCQIGCGSLLRR